MNKKMSRGLMRISPLLAAAAVQAQTFFDTEGGKHMNASLKKFAVLAMAAAGLSGCAIRQNVRPVEQLASKQVCVVENPAVKNGFLEVYRNVLISKGFEVKVLPQTASLLECPVTTTYTANWRWDLAMYMAYAQIKVYSAAKPNGEAVYDATRGGGNLGKFISAEKKIAELVNQLFPGGAGS